MNNIIQNIAGMGKMTEEIIAGDLLLYSKSAINMYALALGCVTSPEVRETLHRHFESITEIHNKITDFMIKNNYVSPTEPKRQIIININAIDKLLNTE